MWRGLLTETNPLSTTTYNMTMKDKQAGMSRAAIIADMTQWIEKLGPSNVSKHCVDPAEIPQNPPTGQSH